MSSTCKIVDLVSRSVPIRFTMELWYQEEGSDSDSDSGSNAQHLPIGDRHRLRPETRAENPNPIQTLRDESVTASSAVAAEIAESVARLANEAEAIVNGPYQKWVGNVATPAQALEVLCINLGFYSEGFRLPSLEEVDNVTAELDETEEAADHLLQRLQACLITSTSIDKLITMTEQLLRTLRRQQWIALEGALRRLACSSEFVLMRGLKLTTDKVWWKRMPTTEDDRPEWHRVEWGKLCKPKHSRACYGEVARNREFLKEMGLRVRHGM